MPHPGRIIGFRAGRDRKTGFSMLLLPRQGHIPTICPCRDAGTGGGSLRRSIGICSAPPQPVPASCSSLTKSPTESHLCRALFLRSGRHWCVMFRADWFSTMTATMQKIISQLKLLQIPTQYLFSTTIQQGLKCQ